MTPALWPPKVRTLFASLFVLVLLAPLLALLLARVYENLLVRQTEEALLAEAVFAGECFRGLNSDDASQALGAPARDEERFAPLEARLDLRTSPLLGRAERGPPRPPITATATLTTVLSAMLERVMVRNLSGLRVLDARGNVIASSLHETGYGLAQLPEVAAALGGGYDPVLRERKSDDPRAPLEGISRAANVRLSLAIPVFRDPRTKLGSGGEVIAVVYAARTPLGVDQALYRGAAQLSWPVALAAGIMLVVVLLLTTVIAGPLGRLKHAATRVASGDRRASLEVRGFAPQEIHALAQSLKLMRGELEARAKVIEEFAANVVHELKTPLTSIRGAAELLIDADPAMDAAPRKRFLENIHSDAVRAADLVQRILQLARIEAQPPARTSIDLGAFLEAITERYARRGQSVRVTFSTPRRTVNMEPDQLESLLLNLLDNAQRHGEGAPIDVTVSEGEGGLALQVRDHGPEVPEEQVKRFFERFYSTERARGGTGLGLSIVRAIAVAHGGSVRAERKDRGISFIVTLADG